MLRSTRARRSEGAEQRGEDEENGCHSAGAEVRADEAFVGPQLVRLTHEGHAALGEDVADVGELERVGEVLLDEQDRHPLILQRRHAFEELLDHTRVVSDLIAVMAQALDQDTTKALTQTAQWQAYLESRRSMEETRKEIEKFVEMMKANDR